MNEFLKWSVLPETTTAYRVANSRAAEWLAITNREFDEAGIPLIATHLTTIWTIQFTQPGRYNWLLQYYLRAEGINLSWVGTGRCMFNFDFSAEDYRDLTTRIISAARAMQRDKW